MGHWSVIFSLLITLTYISIQLCLLSLSLASPSVRSCITLSVSVCGQLLPLKSVSFCLLWSTFPRFVPPSHHSSLSPVSRSFVWVFLSIFLSIFYVCVFLLFLRVSFSHSCVSFLSVFLSIFCVCFFLIFLCVLLLLVCLSISCVSFS